MCLPRDPSESLAIFQPPWPPSIDIDNAPTRLISTPIDIHRFRSASVTVSADWNTLYDQGGLILFIPDEDTTTWLKTGIELLSGGPSVMSVATTQWSDTATLPLGKEKGGKVTIQVERQVKEGEKLVVQARYSGPEDFERDFRQ